MAILNKDMRFKEELTKFMESENKDEEITRYNLIHFLNIKVIT